MTPRLLVNTGHDGGHGRISVNPASQNLPNPIKTEGIAMVAAMAEITCLWLPNLTQLICL